MADSVPLEALRSTSLNVVRRAIPQDCYRRSALQTFGWLGFDLALYLGALAGVFTSASALARLLFGIGAGCAVAFMFVWAHDAAHGALFRSKWVTELVATAVMLPSLNMYRLWSHGHNRVHHGFTSYTPIDWIWRPLTPEAYAARPRWSRLLYRVERSPYGCALHYLLRVWWPGMVMYRPARGSRERLAVAIDKLVTLLFALVLGGMAYVYAGGITGVLAALVVPFLVFNYFIALFVFLHHTHPDVPFFDNRAEWSNTIGQVYCSIVVRCSWPSELLIHNIMIHVPHHVDPRIPFYRLKRAYRELQAHYGEYIHEYRFHWTTVRMIFKRCQLYDFERMRWYTFRAACASRTEQPA